MTTGLGYLIDHEMRAVWSGRTSLFHRRSQHAHLGRRGDDEASRPCRGVRAGKPSCNIVTDAPLLAVRQAGDQQAVVTSRCKLPGIREIEILRDQKSGLCLSRGPHVFVTSPAQAFVQDGINVQSSGSESDPNSVRDVLVQLDLRATLTSWGAGAEDARGREALCKYILRPPISQERLHLLPDGLVRIELRKPYRDGTPTPSTWTHSRCSVVSRPAFLPRAGIRFITAVCLPQRPSSGLLSCRRRRPYPQDKKPRPIPGRPPTGQSIAPGASFSKGPSPRMQRNAPSAAGA